MENVAYFLTEPEKFEKRSVPMPKPGSKDVLIELKENAICGSDFVFFGKEEHEGKPIDFPLFLGHECSGVVIETGNEVSSLKAGDRVTIEPQIPCGTCEYCMSGRYNLCRSLKFLAVPDDHIGSFQRYLSWPEHMVHKLPDSVTFTQGALMEPFCVGLEAAQRAEVRSNSTVAVFGAGSIGLMSVLACRLAGAVEIISTDIYEDNLKLAGEIGAKYTFYATDPELEKKILEATDGKGPDIIIESSGALPSLKMAGHVIKAGGVIALIGLNFGEKPFNFFEIQVKGVDIRSIFRYRNQFPGAIKAVADGRADIDRIVTNHFPMEEIQAAFEYMKEHRAKVIKTVLDM